MGESIVRLYRNQVKKEWKTAFLSAVIFGFLVHTYKFTNYFPNHDGLFNFWSTQDMVASGRWFLAPVCAISSCFDLPWVIGVFSVLYMALTSVLLTEVFGMKNPVLISLSSGLLVSFPAVTETMFFQFTADGYMLAMLLGTAAVHATRLSAGIDWKRAAAAVICICLACAIYQAYVAYTFILAVSVFLCELLENRHSTKAYWRWIAYQAGIFACAMLLYYLIWQGIMKVSGISPASYEGISAMGISGAGALLTAAKQCITSFVWFFLERNPMQYGVSVYSVLGILFCGALLVICGIACRGGGLLKRPSDLLLFILCLAALPFGSFLCYFISPGVEYFTRMLQAIVVLHILLAVLCERWAAAAGKNLVMLLLCAVVFNNAVTANVCYAQLNRCHEQSMATAAELSARIHLADDGTAENVAFVGAIGGNWTVTEEKMMDASQMGTLGQLKTVNYDLLSDRDLIVLFLDRYLDFTLEYYRTHDVQPPEYRFSQTAPVPQGYTLRFPVADERELEAIFAAEDYQSMGVWPGKNAVRQIGKTIVVRLSQ